MSSLATTDFSAQKYPTEVIMENIVHLQSNTQNTSNHTVKCIIWRNILRYRRVIFALLFGQFMSCLICSTAIASEYLQKAYFKAPMAQSFAVYIFLGLIYGGIFCWRVGFSSSSDASQPLELQHNRGSSDPGLLAQSSGSNVTGTSLGFWQAFRVQLFAIFRPAQPPAGPENDIHETLCHSSATSIHWRHLILYAALSIADVEGNFLMVMAYQHTSMVSVQVLDCASIPTVIVLSVLLMRYRYGVLHAAGVFGGLLGAVGLIVADVLTGRATNTSPGNPLFGDVLVVCGAMLYGCSNTLQEFMLKKHQRPLVEVLGFIGLFGSIVSGIQLLIVEREQLSNQIGFIGSVSALVPLAGYVIAMFTFYSLFPVLVARTSATLLNLSLLSSDFYTLLAGLVLFNYSFDLLYIFSWLLVLIGVTLFLLRPARELRDAEALCDCLPFCAQRPAISLSANLQQSSDSYENPISNIHQTI